MRNHLDAKVMAKALKSRLERQDIDISHSQALEIVAAQFGFDNWNILAAKIEKSGRRAGAGCNGGSGKTTPRHFSDGRGF